jgi:glycosyltransferase involved in cell wall biosynthesis
MRILVVSHPSVLAVNQSVYRSMSETNPDVMIVVPDRWRHEYSTTTFAPDVLAGLEGKVRPLPIVLPGRPQRHFYSARPSRIIREFSPDVIFLEQESYSCAAMQWGMAAWTARVPFGLQSAENLDRRLPLTARVIRDWTLRRASFVVARSPTAAHLAGEWGATGRVVVVPHAVPLWDVAPQRPAREFTVGFAGRLIPEKGLHDLVAATRRIPGPVRLLLVGDGILRAELENEQLANGRIEVRAGFPHHRMPEAYSEMDVLVLPSRTTSTWVEQFGRVLVEALSCGVPVVGSDSGEIPWVVDITGGGRTFREGDCEQLAQVLDELRVSPEERARLAERGRAVITRLFTADACARAMAEVLSDLAAASRS